MDVGVDEFIDVVGMCVFLLLIIFLCIGFEEFEEFIVFNVDVEFVVCVFCI